MQKGKLHLIPNLIAADTATKAFPPHNLEAIRHISHYLVEDIRTARRFLSGLDLGLNIRDLVFDKLDKQSKIQEVLPFLEIILQGDDIAVISESGCPGVADPGNIAVKWAHQEGIRVVPYVGPSSILMALMASGLNGQNFCFRGYLPVKEAERITKIKELEKQSLKQHQTQVFIETPYRNTSLWKSLLSHLLPNTQLCVAYDLMGEAEFVRTLRVADWKNQVFQLDKLPALFLFQA